ncbi:MAG: tetratricopeptide repeat-containing sensor histidine kinase, partial [Bacteroidales bacterium]|nr:tetratricopeptide repeat-containing sensor histidine kinase [Bacteroidales bacterium]
KSLENFFESLKISETLVNKKIIANSLNGIGIIYASLNDYDKAIDYYQRSLEISENISDLAGVQSSLNNIGLIFYYLNDYDKALKYYFKSLKISRELENKQKISYSLNNIGLVYISKGEYNKALDYYRRSLKLKKEMDDIWGIATSNINIGGVFLRLNNYDSSKIYIDKVLEVAKSMKWNHLLKSVYKSYADLYSAKGNYKKALEYYKLFKEVHDSLYSYESTKTIAEIQTKYEIVKKEKEIQLLQRDNEIKELELNKRRFERNSIFAGFILIVILVLVLYNRNRIKNKANKLLNEKNEQIENANSELAIKNQHISKQNEKLEILNSEQKELIATKDKFFSIIAHDLKSPFNAILGFSNFLYEDFDDFNETQKKEFIKNISDSSEETFKLLENLLDWSRSQSGNLNFKSEILNLKEILNNTTLFLTSQIDTKNIGLYNNIQPDITVFADKNMLKTIFRNLISNAIKFTHKGGEVNISSKLKANFVEIKISDNGVGISEENIKKLFRIDEKFKTNGTANEKGTGLGLILCREFVEKSSGKIWVESEEGKGSNFCFTIPVEK